MLRDGGGEGGKENSCLSIKISSVTILLLVVL